MTLNLPLFYVLWLEEYCQISLNKNRLPNLWHVISILVSCVLAYTIKLFCPFASEVFGWLYILPQKNQKFQKTPISGQPFQLHSDVPVEIYIMSPLDSPPIFAKRLDNVYYIRENSPVGRVVTQLEATTSEIDTELKYKLASTDYVNEELFQIDQAGRVIISGM